jgi:hypothetical protein
MYSLSVPLIHFGDYVRVTNFTLHYTTNDSDIKKFTYGCESVHFQLMAPQHMQLKLSLLKMFREKIDEIRYFAHFIL